MNSRSGKWVVRLVFFALLIGAWQILYLSGHWPDYEVPGPLVVGGELGAGFVLPNGTVFYIGGSTHTAIYTPGASDSALGTWVAGPDFPQDANGVLMRAFDAPAGPASKRARSMRRWCCCHEWCRRGLGRFPDQLFRV